MKSSLVDGRPYGFNRRKALSTLTCVGFCCVPWRLSRAYYAEPVSRYYRNIDFSCLTPNVDDDPFESINADQQIEDFSIEPGPSIGSFKEPEDFQLARKSDAWVYGFEGSIKVDVNFLNGTKKQKSFVENVASEWLEFTPRLRLAFSSRRDAPIRISFEEGKSFSAIGRRALENRDLNRATMGIELDINHSESYWRHVVLHEFGHALGLRHEHRHPESGIDWNREIVISELTEKGVKVANIRRNVFKPLRRSFRCKGASSFDRTSVMIYPIKQSWTKNNFSTPLPADLSDGDQNCAAYLYSS